MNWKLELGEAELRTALTEWVKQKYNTDVKPQDIRISIDRGDGDWGHTGPSLSGVTITLPPGQIPGGK